MYILDTHTLLWYLRDSEELCSEKDIYILPKYPVRTLW